MINRMHSHYRHCLVTLLFVLCSFYLQSQGFRVRHYLPTALNNTARSIFESTPGSYITGGITVESLNSNQCNLLTMMGLDAQGQVTWSKKYGNPLFEYLDNTLTAKAYYKYGNNLFYAGCVKENGSTYIGVLIKFDLNGDTLWQKIYRDNIENVVPQMVTRSIDGGFLITGFFQNLTNNSQPCLVIKTDFNGNELWRKRINKSAPNVSDGKAIVQDSVTKKIVIGGYQYIGNSSSWTEYDHILILDSLGTKLNQITLSGTGAGGMVRDLIQTNDKKIVAVGWATFPQMLGGTNLMSPYIVKFDLNSPATPIWRVNYFDYLRLMNVFSCIQELDNGDLVVGGTLDTLQMLNMPSNWLTRLVKFGPNGSIKGKRYYDYNTIPGNLNVQYFTSMSLGSDGALVASLVSNNFPSPNPFIFIRYDSTGCDSSLAYCQSLVTNTNTGATSINKKYFDASSIQIFPNPANDILNFAVGDQNDMSELDVLFQDITGRKVKEVKLQSEDSYFRLNISDVNCGTYFLFVRNGQKVLFQGKFVKFD